MTLTVDLPEMRSRGYEAEAERRGVSIDVVIAELAETLPRRDRKPRSGSSRSSGSGLDLRTYARDTDELLADGFGRD